MTRGLANVERCGYLNVALQALAHTPPLKQYFLSGDYEADLNTDNPLGTGGKLASAFAEVLKEMWMNETLSKNPVNPRQFKSQLGESAKQFLGDNEHDAMEVLTCLLDAIHEDVNKVTKKPYIESVEKLESETDPAFFTKVQAMHKQREDSRVMDIFVGQIKTHVKCNMGSCQRAPSITADPFLFLSLPIPEPMRTMVVIFVPLDKTTSCQKMCIPIEKPATVKTLVDKVVAQLRSHQVASVGSLHEKNIVPVDVWKGQVYKWYKDDDATVYIKDNDNTILYEVSQYDQSSSESLITIEVVHRTTAPNDKPATASGIDRPMILRVPTNWTVFELRDEVAKRLVPFLRKDYPKDIMCRLPLSCRPYRTGITQQLGALSLASCNSSGDAACADPKDEREQRCLGVVVGHQRAVYVDWPSALFEQLFDISKAKECNDLTKTCSQNEKTTSLFDCIDLFGKRHQLNEREMWYCRECKKHVQAWRQLSIYRTPPILIIHLKRYQYDFVPRRRSKDSTLVDFPLVGLDISAHVMWSTGNDEETIYDCYAVM